MGEPHNPRDQKTKALEEVQGGGGEEWGPGYCVGEPPLYLFQSLQGLGLPSTWGPPLLCGVCDISPCDGNGGASLTGGSPSPASPRPLPERIEAPIPSGWGQDVGPE